MEKVSNKKGESMPRLLIVEDQHSLREILKAVFEDEYEVKTAENGFEALEIIASWQPDVVITDYAMPAMAGLDLIRAIAKIESRKSRNKNEGQELKDEKKKMKIILYSACLTAEIKREAEALGVVACVDKPFDVEKLQGMIKKFTASPKNGDGEVRRTQE